MIKNIRIVAACIVLLLLVCGAVCAEHGISVGDSGSSLQETLSGKRFFRMFHDLDVENLFFETDPDSGVLQFEIRIEDSGGAGFFPVDKGGVSISGSRVTLSGEEGTTILIFSDEPTLGATYHLSPENCTNEADIYHSTPPEEGAHVLIGGYECVVASNPYIGIEEQLLHTAPERSSPVYHYNQIYYSDQNMSTENLYVYPGCCRIHPGEYIGVEAYTVKEDTIDGVTAHWFFVPRYGVASNIQTSHAAWVFGAALEKRTDSSRSEFDYASFGYVDPKLFFPEIVSCGARRTSAAENSAIEKHSHPAVPMDVVYASDIDWKQKGISSLKIGKAMCTTANLRLRAAPAIDSDIIRTIPKDREVRILQLDREDTIDGIAARWVQVSLPDALSGWCFGGYLE
jgi:hypothetical protein